MLPPHIKALILDMDGVIWRADSPIGDLAEIFAHVEARGITVVGLVIALPLRAKPAERLQLGSNSQQRRETAQRIEQVICNHIHSSNSGDSRISVLLRPEARSAEGAV